ncbi:hypothetical protein GCK32_005168 [Trichostrongylus colubriformis]|uniref:Uncharacterized protein n=1 Tax=Trichostrongylus colubriformis TaxID=6319 RepID=A0AAN8IIR5_TRICO
MPILLQTIAECLLAFFYIFLIIVIVTSKAKVFRNSFFSMFVATGTADVISILSLSFLRLNRELYLGEEYKLVVLVALVSTGTAYIAHMIGNMVIALNRYSAICFAHQYDKTARCIYVAFGMVYAFVSICINLRMFFEWRKMSQSNIGSERKLREKVIELLFLIAFETTT